jgi:hypothetical protein
VNTTLKGLVPGAIYKAHIAAKAAPWLHYREQIPFAPYTSGAADADGNLTLDLPARTEIVVQASDGRGIFVNNSTTRVTSP